MSTPSPAATAEVAPVAARDAPAGPDRPTLAVAGAAAAIVLLAQIPLALGLLDPDVLFEADRAERVLAVNALAAGLTVLAAAALPARRRALALLPGGLMAGAAVGAAATVGGHAWALATAALTLLAAWWTGRLLVRGLRVRALAGVAIVELVIGLGGYGLLVLLLGRLGLLAAWSIGAATIALGALGGWSAARTVWSRRRSVAKAVCGSRIGAACAGLLLLQLAWTTVWLSAPEIMYDALYAKAYLPQLWAHTGSIDPLLAHPVLNVTGLTQFAAVAGHALGAPDVGRALQLLMAGVLAGTCWWLGRRSAAGPLAALAVGLAPHVVWQSATAYDDLMLSAGTVALAIAVLRTADGGAGAERPLALAFAIGLVGGAAIWLKLNQLAVAAVLLGGWVVLCRPLDALPRRAAGVAAGALAIAGPAFLLRWIDTGNPVFPSYNALFKSPHYPAVNEQYNFPFGQQAGLWDAVTAPYDAVVHPWLMSDSMAQGALGLLVAAVAAAVLLGWRHRRRRGVAIVWLSIVLGLLAWWVQFRYLRYALPAALVAVVLVVTLLRSWRPGRGVTLALLAAAGLASAAYLPSTVASFWNVPDRNLPFAAAFGRWDGDDYLRTVFPEKDVLDAYQRVAEPGAIAVSEAHERTFLTARDLSPIWEVGRLLVADGSPPPATGGEALRKLRALGIGWAIVSETDPTHQSGWMALLLERHGEVVFADRSWRLYRLSERPSRPHARASCDERLRGTAGCWSGAVDREPGLAEGERAAHPVPVCAGETLVMRVRTAAGGDASQAWVDGDSGSAKSGHQTALLAPGSTTTLYATAPPGTNVMTVTVQPGAGAHVASVRTAVLGRCDAP